MAWQILIFMISSIFSTIFLNFFQISVTFFLSYIFRIYIKSKPAYNPNSSKVSSKLKLAHAGNARPSTSNTHADNTRPSTSNTHAENARPSTSKAPRSPSVPPPVPSTSKGLKPPPLPPASTRTPTNIPPAYFTPDSKFLRYAQTSDFQQKTGKKFSLPNGDLRITLDRNQAGLQFNSDQRNGETLEAIVDAIEGPTFEEKIRLSRQMLSI